MRTRGVLHALYPWCVRIRRIISAVVVAAALIFTSSATAKQFRPGDLQLCSSHACVDINDRGALAALTSFYYTGAAPGETRAPSIGAPYFSVKFSTNGYVTGIFAAKQLDRFRSGGINTAQFATDAWYRVPPGLASSLRKLAARLQPMRVTRSTVAPIHYYG
jgi:hypothetical protein